MINVEKVAALSKRLCVADNYNEWSYCRTAISQILAGNKTGHHSSYTYLLREWEFLANTREDDYCTEEYERLLTMGWTSSKEERKVYADGVKKLSDYWTMMLSQDSSRGITGGGYGKMSLKEIRHYADMAGPRDTPVGYKGSFL